MDTATPDVVEDVGLRALLDSLVDSLDAPACEWGATGQGFSGKIGKPCDTVAIWYLAVSCGCGATLCQPHAERTRARLDPTQLVIFCTRHDRRVTVEWLPVEQEDNR